MSKTSILLILVATLIGSVGCGDVEVKNETHIHYHKETTITIKGELGIYNIDAVKRKESKPQKPASAEDKS